MDFVIALLTIVLFDIILGGDNAIVIAMAARSLPEHQRKQAIIWGTVGAVIVRALLTMAAVYLLTIPFLQFVGGLLLLVIAFNLLNQKEHQGEELEEAKGFWHAIRIIVAADVLMGVDNVLAIAGAAHGNFFLVVLGLIISVPIIIWGSTWVLRLMDRFPVVVYLGAGVLAWTGGKMMIDDKIIHGYLVHMSEPLIQLAPVILALFLLAIGHWAQNRKAGEELGQKVSFREGKTRDR